MAGSASITGDDNVNPMKDFTRLQTPKSIPTERVTEFKDDSIVTVDLNDLDNAEVDGVDKVAAPDSRDAPLSEPMGGSAAAASFDDDDDFDPNAHPNIPGVPDKEPTPDPTPSKSTAKKGSILSKTTASALDLDQLMIDAYEITWLEWLPETIWATVKADFGVPVARINRDKIMAAKLLHVSDSFWKAWEVFEKVVMSFNGMTPLFDRVQDPSPGQIAFAMTQVEEIRKEPYSQEVLGYIAAHCKEAGLIWLPSPLDVAQENLDAITPPEIQILKKEVRERWEAFEGTDLTNVELREDLFGIHIARLASIQNYVESAGGEA